MVVLETDLSISNHKNPSYVDDVAINIMSWI